MRKVIVTLAAMLALLALAACAEAEKEVTPTPETPAAPKTPAARETPQDEAQEMKRALEELSQRWREAKGKIDYRFRTESDGQVEEGALTLYWQPPHWRLDFDTQSSLISREGGLFVCSSDDRTCLKLFIEQIPPEAFMPLPPMPFFLPSELEKLPSSLEVVIEETARAHGVQMDVERSRRTIAGQGAHCWSVRFQAEGERVWLEHCWSDQGLLLSARGENVRAGEETFNFSLEAQKVGDVSPKDLELPYPVQELPIGIPTPPR